MTVIGATVHAWRAARRRAAIDRHKDEVENLKSQLACVKQELQEWWDWWRCSRYYDGIVAAHYELGWLANDMKERETEREEKTHTILKPIRDEGNETVCAQVADASHQFDHAHSCDITAKVDEKTQVQTSGEEDDDTNLEALEDGCRQMPCVDCDDVGIGGEEHAVVESGIEAQGGYSCCEDVSGGMQTQSRAFREALCDHTDWPVEPSTRWTTLYGADLSWTDHAVNVGESDLEELYFAVMQKAIHVVGIGDLGSCRMLAAMGRKCLNHVIDRMKEKFAVHYRADKIALRDLVVEVLVETWAEVQEELRCEAAPQTSPRC